jgi:CubicO group peptidase (beta-lactamase class C family)
MDVDRLRSELRALAAEDKSSGVILIVREGADLVEIAWGLANRSDEVPVTRETRFGVASVSKMFTAATIGRLVDAGTLSFDRPLVDCLPAELRPRDLDERVTLHHLLTHTSGLSDYSGEVISSEAYGELWVATPSYAFRRPSDFLPLFADKPRQADPGATVRYCNAGFVLLALVAETATSLPFAEVVAREVFAPAGMEDSGYFALDEVHPRTAVGYTTAADGQWSTNVFSVPAVDSGDGGAYVTADDVVRFFDAFDRGQLVAQLTKDAMLARHVPADQGPPGYGYSYGYGFFVAGEGPGYRFGHPGGSPGQSARAFHWPQLGISAVLLSNVTAGGAYCWKLIRETLDDVAMDV